MDIPSGIITNEGYELAELASHNPVFLAFLRPFSCIFCRESLQDIAHHQAEFKAKSITIVLVHMDQLDKAASYFESFGLKDIQQISDPECKLYDLFGLTKGSPSQLFGLKSWMRGFEARKKGLRFQLNVIGDSLQMPGIFILCDNQIKESYIHNNISDKPNYKELIECCAVDVT